MVGISSLHRPVRSKEASTDLRALRPSVPSGPSVPPVHVRPSCPVRPSVPSVHVRSSRPVLRASVPSRLASAKCHKPGHRGTNEPKPRKPQQLAKTSAKTIEKQTKTVKTVSYF